MTAIFKIEETVSPTSETNMFLEMASMFGADVGPVYTRTKLDQMEKMKQLEQMEQMKQLEEIEQMNNLA